jgi:hypothetical protein
MNIHDPKIHTAMIGVLATVLAGAIGAGGLELHNMPKPVKLSYGAASASYALSASQFDTIPFGKHAYLIFAAPNSGDAPDAFADAIERAGGSTKIEGEVAPREGIALSPDTPEGHAIADAISKAIGEPVIVGNDNYNDGKPIIGGQGAFEINIGHPTRKRISK